MPGEVRKAEVGGLGEPFGIPRIIELLRENGGNGMIRFRPEGEENVYQVVVINGLVAAVTTLEGEYQPRFVAEDIVRRFVAGEGEMEWVPFPHYYPPLHLVFFIPLQGGAEVAGTREERDKKEV